MENSNKTMPLNPLKLRQSIRRMFNGTARELISELLQNCQRAEATEVTIETFKTENDTYIVSFLDNGKGLKSFKDIENLISLGDSGFDEEVLKQQKPAGIGINSILANENCLNTVKIYGEEYALEIDKERWWNDTNYWINWSDLVTYLLPTNSKWSFEIFFEVTQSFYEEIIEELSICDPKNANTFYYQNPITLGYSPYFTVTHRYKNKDGKMENIFLSTGYLKAHRADILFSFDYKKGTVFIFRDKLYNSNLDSCINWFGQLIYIKAVKGTIAFYYECNEKTESKLLPLNPTRKEIIQNSAYEEFINSIVDNLINFIILIY